jgi:hypothetical protein
MATSATDICITLPGQLRETAGGWWIVEISKGWICLSRAEVLAGLRRGKRLRRRLAFQARHAPEEDR